jgi:phosphoglycerol transferase MdoB-like AlkP superfamily enzyme
VVADAATTAPGYKVVDRLDIPLADQTFANAWGVCDEDLFRRVLTECDSVASARQPFFAMVMTTSNHRPYTYPPGKVAIPSGTGRKGAVSYTDFAIGQFVDAMKSRPWAQDTLLVIVADHCASSAGKTEVPVDKYHIPMLIYCPAHIQKGKVQALCSQVDVAPTLLGMMNASYTSRFFGKDVLKSDPERALLGNYQKLGLVAEGQVTLLEPRSRSRAYRLEGRDQSATRVDPRLLNDTIACYQSASYLLSHALQKASNPAR